MASSLNKCKELDWKRPWALKKALRRSRSPPLPSRYIPWSGRINDSVQGQPAWPLNRARGPTRRRPWMPHKRFQPPTPSKSPPRSNKPGKMTSCRSAVLARVYSKATSGPARQAYSDVWGGSIRFTTRMFPFASQAVQTILPLLAIRT